LLGLERRRLAALVEGDLDAPDQLHAEDYQLITPGGAVLSKREYLAGVESGALNYQVFEAAAKPVIKMFECGAILRYRARIEIELPDGRDAGLFWHTDVYERRAGQWQVVWSQATRIRDGP